MKSSVMLTVNKDTSAEGVLIPAGTYAGERFSRKDMNAAGGESFRYLLTVANPVTEEAVTFVENQNVDVTHLVLDGTVTPN